MAYDSYFASVYDAFTFGVDYSQRADFLVSVLKDKGITEGTILDVACGTGSISLNLLERGFDVIANDISFDMLNIAREKLSGFGERVLLLCQDMCELDLYGTVDAAVCCLDSINHLLYEEDIDMAFSRISLFMRPDGIFIFDVNTEYKHQQILSDSTFVYEDDGDAFLVWQNSECDEDNVVEMYIDIFLRNKDGSYRRQSDTVTERAYSVKLLSEMLKNNGFEILDIYGDMMKDKPSIEEERIYFVARKK